MMQNLAREARLAVGEGVSQRQFARLLGVTNASVSRWESGVVEPTGAIRSLLRVVAAHPRAARRVLERNPDRQGAEQ